MWYKSTANGGRFSWVKSESPLSPRVSNILDEAIAKYGIKNIRVHVSSDCYFSKYELINDETLETILVDVYTFNYGQGMRIFVQGENWQDQKTIYED